MTKTCRHACSVRPLPGAVPINPAAEVHDYLPDGMSPAPDQPSAGTPDEAAPPIRLQERRALPETDQVGEEILTAREVKDRLKCGLSTVYDLFERGGLRGF